MEGQRLFLALWPGQATRQALLAWQQAARWPAGARLTRLADLHVTLHFLGPVEAERRPALQAALAHGFSPWTAAAVDQPHQPWHGREPDAAEARLCFDAAVTWPNAVAVMQAASVPPAAAELQQRLAEALRAQGFAVDSRAWKPHVTLARQALGARLPVAAAGRLPPVDFSLREAVLVASRGGYQVLQRWA